jgi:cell pole-organizing protein PopZ
MISETDSSGDERHTAIRRTPSAAVTTAAAAAAAATAAAAQTSSSAGTAAAAPAQQRSARHMTPVHIEAFREAASSQRAPAPAVPSLVALPLDDPDDFVPGIHTHYKDNGFCTLSSSNLRFIAVLLCSTQRAVAASTSLCSL